MDAHVRLGMSVSGEQAPYRFHCVARRSGVIRADGRKRYCEHGYNEEERCP